MRDVGGTHTRRLTAESGGSYAKFASVGSVASRRWAHSHTGCAHSLRGATARLASVVSLESGCSAGSGGTHTRRPGEGSTAGSVGMNFNTRGRSHQPVSAHRPRAPAGGPLHASLPSALSCRSGGPTRTQAARATCGGPQRASLLSAQWFAVAAWNDAAVTGE